MHGRIKVRTTEEQKEAKRREQQEKLKIYLGATSKIVSKRENGEYDEEGLELTGRLLEQNPDFYTLWNYRREILLFLKPKKNKEELKALTLVELGLTQNCLRVNPKSYGAWHHRLWAMEFDPDADWKKELKLCGYFLSKDERNFHCWHYRRLVAKKCGVAPEEELAYSTELIEANFSNYSAWHYRSTLLPIVYPGHSKGSLKEEILLKELDMVQNAAFTDPSDQSVWFYHRWLLGRSKIPLQILNVSVFKPQKSVAVLFSEPIKIRSECMKLHVNEFAIDISWNAVSFLTSGSTIWMCNLPSDIDLEDGKSKISVDFQMGSEISSLICHVNGNKSFAWRKANRTDTFRSELSAATKDVLEQELESCQQLNELEPDCKWTLFTSILIMRALNDSKFQTNVSDYMEQLTKIDASRSNYYKDLGSKFVIEDIIEILPVEADEVDFSNRKLTSLHHFDQLILIEKIDLSSNYLTSVYPLCFLICAKDINLDNNQLTNLDGLENLQNLKHLSVKKNLISTSCLTVLKTSTSLEELYLEGNPIVDDPEYLTLLKKFPKLKLADSMLL